jgi:hypothetical protein
MSETYLETPTIAAIAELGYSSKRLNAQKRRVELMIPSRKRTTTGTVTVL